MVEEQTLENQTLKQQRKLAAKPLLWIAIAGMVMMFAGLTSGYMVSRSSRLVEGDWLVFELPSIFYASTALVIAISAVLHFALTSIKKNAVKQANVLMTLALVMGITFVVFQYLGWQELYQAGIYFTGEGSNSAGSWVYVITLFHVLHLVAGIIVLIVTVVKSNMGYYSSEDYLGIDLCSIYWHFVDVLWVLLFMFLSFYR